MPLKLPTHKTYYEDFLTSDDIIDEIVFGRKEYPVIDLCISREFDIAYLLLQKGYCCLHEDMAHEVLTILRSVCTLRTVSATGTEKIPHILTMLSNELEQLEETNYRTLVNELGRALAENRYCSPNLNILTYIRRNLPDLYISLIRFGDFSPSTLVMLNTEFVEKYFAKLEASDSLEAYTISNQVDKYEATTLLMNLMSLESFDEIEASASNLYHIYSKCPGIFPKNFTCDVVILSSIAKLRNIVANLDETDPKPGDAYFDFDTTFRSFIGRTNRLLRFHMKEDYTMDRVAEVLIISCGADGTEFPLRETEIPQLCDYYILDLVVKYAKTNYLISKLPVFEDTLEKANVAWMDMHQDEEWKQEYDIAFPRISDLTEWFYNNCAPK